MSTTTFPRIGMRMVKTSIAVFLCFLIFLLRGEEVSPIYAAIAALLSMQPDFEDSLKVASNRTIGTFIGGAIGTLALLVIRELLWDYSRIIHYFIISLLLIPLIYITVLVKMPSSTTIACGVFLIIAIADVDMNAIQYSINRIIDTLVGIFVSLGVNAFRLPSFQSKKPLLFVTNLTNTLFNSEGEVSSTTAIKLNQIILRGAKVTVATHLTPAAFLHKVEEIKFELPIIVMGGAALYNIKENTYIKKWEIDRDVYSKVMSTLRKLDMHAFVRSVKNNVLYIFYDEFTDKIQEELFEIQHSLPEKHYVYGELPEYYAPLSVLVVDKKERIKKLIKELDAFDKENKVETVSYKDPDNSNYSYLNIYAKGVSEGAAAIEVKKMAEADDIVAFGANAEDISLFKIADKSYVVSNGDRKLKYMANSEIGSNNNDSVAREMCKIFNYIGI